ncbi:MAG TPA: hypothetical protein VMZ28_12800 [Kofleriaceae bacterium]|nr:hypothetical protein [Kofleriaceae bacterium]
MKKFSVALLLAFLSLGSVDADAAEKPHRQGGFLQKFKVDQARQKQKDAAAGRKQADATKARQRAEGKNGKGATEHTQHQRGSNWDRHSKKHSSRQKDK